MDRSANIGIQVHRVYEVYLWILFREIFHSGNHIDEAFSEIFAAMTSNQNQFLAPVETCHVVTGVSKHISLFISKCLVCLKLFHDHMQSVNHCIPCYDYLTVSILFSKVLLTKRCRGKVESGNTSRDLAVHFFRPWAIYVVRTETGLNVANRYLLVERRKSSSSTCCSITMNKHHIWFTLFENVTHSY